MAVYKVIFKFPKLGETPFITKVAVGNFESAPQFDAIRHDLLDRGAELVEDDITEKLVAVFRSTDPREAEQTVRWLGQAGFVEPQMAASMSRPSLEGK
jgi:hypothetical protein